MNATAWCRVEDVPALAYDVRVVAAWSLTLILGATLHLLGRRHGRSAWRAAGVAVMTLPVWLLLLAIAPNLIKTFCAQGDIGSILPGRPSLPSTSDFVGQAVGGLLNNVGYPAVGFLLWLHGREQEGASAGRSWTAKLAELVPMGRSAVASLRLGAAFLPPLAVANLLLAAAVGLQLRSTDASPYFANMTAPAALGLAFAAGLGEELLYRGVMQQGLKRAFAPLIANRWVVAGFAIALQAIPFAYAHAGYGDVDLLLFNAAFAILAGLIVERWGLGAAVALHALIDLFAFFVSTPSPDFLFWAVALAAAAGVVVAVVVEVRRGMRAWRARSA